MTDILSLLDEIEGRATDRYVGQAKMDVQTLCRLLREALKVVEAADRIDELNCAEDWPLEQHGNELVELRESVATFRTACAEMEK